MQSESDQEQVQGNLSSFLLPHCRNRLLTSSLTKSILGNCVHEDYLSEGYDIFPLCFANKIAQIVTGKYLAILIECSFDLCLDDMDRIFYIITA